MSGAVKAERPAGSPDDLKLRHVDRHDAALLHDQVAAEIRQAIANGEAAPGDRLPKARDLAAILGVNTNTVLRALRLLRDEGLVEVRRGRGITVSGTPERSAMIEQIRDLLDYARTKGYRKGDLIQLIESLPNET
jgi:GntR family transcriptional regulator